MGKYDDAIGGGKIILDVEEVLNEESAKKVDDRIKKQRDDLSKPIEIDVKTKTAETKLKNLERATKKIQKSLKDAVDSKSDVGVIVDLIEKHRILEKQVKKTSSEVDKTNKFFVQAKQNLQDTEKLIKKITSAQSTLNKTQNKGVDSSRKKTDALAGQSATIKNDTDAMAKHGEVVDDVTQKTKGQIEVQQQHIESTEAAARAQEKLNKAEEKSLKLKPRKEKDGRRMSGAYATEGGLFEVDHDADGWKVHRKTAAGFYELVKVYQTKKEIQQDAALIAEQEAYAQKQVAEVMTDAQKQIGQGLVELSNAYAEMAKRAGGGASFANKFAEVFEGVKSGALSAADAIEKLNKVIDASNAVKAGNVAQNIKEEAKVIERAAEAKFKYYEIDESVAKRAKEANSFDDYVPGSATRAYRQAIDELSTIVEAKKKQFPDKAEQLDKWLDTYAKRYAEYINKNNQIDASVPSVMIAGPAGISQKSKDRQNQRRDANYKFFQEKIQTLEDKIQNLGSGTQAIRGDDVDAVKSLEEKIDGLKKAHQIMVEANKYFRKHKNLDGFDGLSDEMRKQIEETRAAWGRPDMQPFPQYALQNSNAEIKRLEGRLLEIKGLKDADGLKEMNEFYSLTTDKEDMRIRISFEIGKPDQEVIDMLKGKAFKWSPKNNAWQRQLTGNAIRDTKSLQEALHGYFNIPGDTVDQSSVQFQEQQMKKTAELIGSLQNKYGDKFGEIFGSLDALNTTNAEAMYDVLIAKEKEYTDAIKQRVAALTEFTQGANNSFQDVAHLEEYQKRFTSLAQQIIDGEININSAKQSLMEFVDTLGKAAKSSDKNEELMAPYKKLYGELEKLVDLSKQLKPGHTPEYEEMMRLTDNVGYVNNQEEAIAEIKAWYENVKKIKSSLKNGLSVYKHVSGDGYEYEETASEQTLAQADATLRGYIISAVTSFGYTLSEAMDDFPKKRMRYFVEDQINQYYEVDARNSAYSAGVEAFNAPIQEQIDAITAGISHTATSIDNMGKVMDVLSDLTYRAEDVNRYTLSTEANKIGNLIGVKTPYEEVSVNAKRIESYEELCRVVARYNELKSDAVIYGGKDYPGFDENVELEYRELISRLKLTAGDDVFGKFRFDIPKDIEKLANAIGLKLSQTYEADNGQLSFIEGAKEAVGVENVLQDEIKETNALLEGQISIEEHLAAAAAERARKQLEKQEDLSKIVSRDIINQALQNVDVEGILSGYGLQGDKLTQGIDMYKDFAGALYLKDAAPKNAHDIAEEIFYFVTENAQRTEEVVKTLQDFRDYMKLRQIRIPENMEQTFAAEFTDEWKDLKKLFAIGGNSKNKKRLLTTSRYASTPDALIEELISNGFSAALSHSMMQDYNGSPQDALRILLDAVQRAKDEFKLPNVQTILGLDDDGLNDWANKYAQSTTAIAANVERIHAAMNKTITSGDALVNSAESAAAATEKQVSAERELLDVAKEMADIASGQANAAGTAVSVEEIIARDMDAALERLRASKNNETTLFSLKGVFEGEDLVDQAQAMVRNIAEQANLSLQSFDVEENTIKVKLYNDELKVTVDQMYKLKAASEDAESATLELMKTKYHQDVKALNQNPFDSASAQKAALSSVEKIRADAERAKYDLQALEDQAKAISSSEDVSKFNSQLKVTQNEIQAIKNATATKSSMNPLINMQRDMKIANTEIDTMKLKLDKLGQVDGVKDASDMIAKMRKKVDEYNAATTPDSQQKAYNDYSDLRHSFKAQMEYINAAKAFNESQETAAKQTDPIREQYQSILDTVTKINAINKELMDLGGKNELGVYNNLILQLKSEKESLMTSLSQTLSDAGGNLGQTILGDAQKFATPRFFSEEDASHFNAFLQSAQLAPEEIDRLSAAFRQADKIGSDAMHNIVSSMNKVQAAARQVFELNENGAVIGTKDGFGMGGTAFSNAFGAYREYMQAMQDLSRQDAIGANTASIDEAEQKFLKYANALNVAIQKEKEYFAGRDLYTKGNHMNMLVPIDEAELSKMTEAHKREQDLKKAAQEFAQESKTSGAIVTKFVRGADGIAKLDFSVLEQGTNTIRKFRMEMDSAGNIYSPIETTVSSYESQTQAAYKQMEALVALKNRLSSAGVNVGDGTSVEPVQRLLNLISQLNEQLTNPKGADNNFLAQLMKDSKLTAAEIEKLYKLMFQTENAIAGNQMTGIGKGDPTQNVYGQLADAAQKFAETQGGATLQIGRFDAATNTLHASLVHTNGAVEDFRFHMDGLSGQMTSQQAGVSKLTTSWDRLKASLASTGKHLMTALVGYNVFFKAISEVRKGISYVKEIDLALTELKKVTDETEASYNKFLQTAAKTAGQIGSTVSDFTEATANFARLGYTMSESAEMAKTAIVYRNVADGLDTVEAATDSIISTMKAFGIESSDTMGIVDRFNEVGNNFAITSAGIGDALQRSASALYAAGNTIDESIALVTAAM